MMSSASNISDFKQISSASKKSNEKLVVDEKE